MDGGTVTIYNMVEQHRPGIKHGNADALSRIPDVFTPCPSNVGGVRPTFKFITLLGGVNIVKGQRPNGEFVY